MLVALFYKNYIFNKKLLHLHDYRSFDFSLCFKLLRRRNKMRIRLTQSRYIPFRNTNLYNSDLIAKTRFSKNISRFYRVRMPRSRKPKRFIKLPTSAYKITHPVPLMFIPSISTKIFYPNLYALNNILRPQPTQLGLKVNTLRASVIRNRRTRRVNFFKRIKFVRFGRLRRSLLTSFTKKTYNYTPKSFLLVRVNSRSKGNRRIKKVFAKSILNAKKQIASVELYSTRMGFHLQSLYRLRKPGETLKNLGVQSSFKGKKRFKKYASASLTPPRFKSFILHYVGLLIIPKLNFKLRLGSRPISITRRKLYSFIKPNELRFRAFSARRRLTVIKLIKRVDKSTLSSRRLFSKDFVYTLFKRKHGSQGFSANPLFRLTASIKSNVYYRENFFKFYDNSQGQPRVFQKDVSIERIRFKPGYQRLWRRFRLALAESLNIRYTYQQQLTKYLIKFSRKIFQRSYTVKENSLRNVMIYSRLVPDLATLKLMLDNSIIFLNHKLVGDWGIFIYKNDFIQFEVTIWFYIFSKWVLLWVRSRNSRFKRLVYKKSLAGRYKVMKQRKQKSRYTPKWIFLVDFDFIDVKSFLEVDYMTLSFFVVYDFRFFLFYRPEVFTENKLNIYRLYNWKYIN